MGEGLGASITEHFGELPDPRVERTKLHSLHDILVIALCAVIGGADSWVEVAIFGTAKEAWFRRFLCLANGIPSHDTFGRVFAALDPDAFCRCFTSWLSTGMSALNGQVIAIDGQTLRRSFETATGKRSIHRVSAWASEARLVLGQVKTAEKSNEITAIPELLRLLEIRGCIVTIDAMGCQRAIVSEIVARGAGYVISLKGNQTTMHDEVREYFAWAEKQSYRDVPHTFFESVEKDHGRIETRRCWCTSDVEWFADRQKWAGLRSFAMVESERTLSGETTSERRFFISSLPGTDAEHFAQAVRAHWGIENGLHWVMDVTFRQDECRVRVRNAAQNFATLRHLALNLIRQETSVNGSLRGRRRRAGWDEAYLGRILTSGARPTAA